MKSILLTILLAFGTLITAWSNDDVIPRAEAIAASTPLALKATTTKLGEHEIKVTPLTLSYPIFTNKGFKSVTGTSIAGNKLYLMIGMGKAIAYHLPTPATTTLKLDTDFGTNGELKVDEMNAKGISANAQGDVFAHGGWSTIRYHGNTKTEVPGQGALHWRPGKNYGFLVGNNKLTLYANGQLQEKSITANGAGQIGSAG